MTVLSLAVLLALMFAAVLPISALAQGEVPPVDAPAVEEVVPPVEEPATVPEILDAVPAGTDLVVLDESGEALPLASAAAADVILTSDPMWCPVGVTIANPTDCENDLTVTGLLAKLKIAGKDADGVIYFMSSYTTDDVFLDGDVDSDADLFLIYDNALTLQGGWDGVTTGAITYSGSSVFDVGVKIINWHGNVTVNDFTITNLSGDGLYVNSTGNVTVNDGVFSGNSDVGLYLDAGYSRHDGEYRCDSGECDIKVTNVIANNNTGNYGAELYTSVGGSDVTVTNSIFNGNHDSGIYVEASYDNCDNGTCDITLTGVTANNNGGAGAELYTDHGGNINITDSFFGSDGSNDYQGIYAETGYDSCDTVNCDITLTNVTVSNNGTYGAELYAANDSSVTLNNVTATYNHNAGAVVAGNITVNGGNYSHNGGVGLLVNGRNSAPVFGNTGPIGSQPTSVNYTINGGNFNDNGYPGLEVYNRTGGDVTLSNVTALRNGGLPLGSGGILGNDSAYSGAVVEVGGAGNINVVCGNYSDNGAYGLELYTNTGNANVNGATLVGNGYGEDYFESLGGGAILFGLCSGGEDGPHGFKAQNNLIPPTSSPAQVCDGEKKVVLKAGEAFGAYENLCDVEFQLKDVAEDALPGALPSGATQLGSLEAQVTSGGNALGELPTGGKITLKFPVPAGTDASTLVVLFWNGTAWVEVAGGTVVDGFYVVTVEKPGNYVLAAQ